MGHPLIPDLSATIEVDPREAVLDLQGDEVALAEYRANPGDRVLFRVGYIKPAKFTELRFRLAKMRPALKDADAEGLGYAEAVLDVYRDLCRWSISGWNLDAPMPQEEEKVRGRAVKVAAEVVVEAIEAKGWLHALAIKALEYNSLSDDSKKK
jgi:hypothetical protein